MSSEAEASRAVVITGPSGVGKSTLVGEVRRRTKADFSVSATTRPRRNGEVDGRDYRFIERADFERMIADGDLLEWAEVFGELYGTPAAPVREAIAAGRTILLDIDFQGGRQVHRRLPGATFVLIVPPDAGELRRRLRERGTESDENLRRRLDAAVRELSRAREAGFYTHEVVNNDLDRAAEELTAIIRQSNPEKPKT